MKKWHIISATLALFLAVLSSVCRESPLPGIDAQVDEARKLIAERTSFTSARELLLDVLKAAPNNAEANYLLAFMYQSTQAYAQAYGFAERAVKADPSKADYHLLFGRCISSKLKDASLPSKIYLAWEARQEFREAAQLDPQNQAAHKALVSFYSQAPFIYGGNSDAFKEAAVLSRLDPAEGHIAKAEILMMMDKHDEAHKEMQSAIDVDPRNGYTYIQVSRLFFQHGMAPEVTPYLQKALQLDPHSDYAAYHLAEVYVVAGENYPAAEKLLHQYMEHWHDENFPPYDKAHWCLGLLYSKTGRTELAMHELQKSLEANPNFVPAKQAIAQIQMARNAG